MTVEDMDEIERGEQAAEDEYARLDAWLRGKADPALDQVQTELQQIAEACDKADDEVKDDPKDDDINFPGEDQGGVEADLTDALDILNSTQEFMAFCLDADLNPGMEPALKAEGMKIFARIVNYLNSWEKD
jgi:hypothetical protein